MILIEGLRGTKQRNVSGQTSQHLDFVGKTITEGILILCWRNIHGIFISPEALFPSEDRCDNESSFRVRDIEARKATELLRQSTDDFRRSTGDLSRPPSRRGASI